MLVRIHLMAEAYFKLVGKVYYREKMGSRVQDYRFILLLEFYSLPSISPSGLSADKQGGITSHEPKRQPLEEVSGGLSLLLASVSG